MNIAPIADEELLSHLGGLAPDGLSLFAIGGPDGPKGGELRGALLHGSVLVNQMRANHELGVMESFVLGQAYLAAGLLASTLKGEDSLGLRLDCEGRIQGWSVEARAGSDSDQETGYAVRGFLFDEAIALTEAPDRFDTAPLIDSGTLTMTRFIGGAPRPFTGTVALKSGRLAEDLAAYFLESEQIRSAFALGLHFDPKGRIDGAGGLYLQALPGATDATMERAEALLASLPALGLYFAEGGGAETLLSSRFAALGLELHGGAPLAFFCECGRERFASFMSEAQGGLLEDLVATGPWPVEAVCHKCGSRYHWTREELEARLAARISG